MDIAESIRRLFRTPAIEWPADVIFPNIAVPLATMDGQEVSTSSNATIIDSENGFLVTGRHCIMPRQKIVIKTDEWHEARLIAMHPRDDIALIHTRAKLITDTPKIKWALKTPSREMLMAKGWLRKYDESMEEFNSKSFCGELVGGLMEDGWPMKSDLKKKDCVLGMSGSPVINSRRELVGIFTARAYSWFGGMNRTVYVTPIWFAKDLI